MIRIDLGKEDGRKKSLLGISLGAALPKRKGGLGGDLGELPASRPLSKLWSFVGNLGGASMLAIVAAASAAPHVLFTRYRSYLVEQHQARVAALDQKVATVSSEIEKMTPYKRELESYEAQKKLVRDRIAAIQELLAQRSAPVAVLDVIGQALPQRAWLVDIEIKKEGTTPLVIVDGRAYSNEDISDYVDRLKESSMIEDVELEGVGAERGDGQGAADVKGFKLHIRPRGFGPRPGVGANAAAQANGGAGLAEGGAARSTAADGGGD
jgi:Tfp pilus assembly protein PilN